MHRFIKNILFVLMVFFVCVGFPFGVSIITGGNTKQGIVVIATTLIVIATSVILASYYHKRNVHVSGYGIVGAIIATLIGIYFVVFGLAEITMFLKISIIGATLGLHTMATKKFGFFMQKAAIGAAIISLAFLHTVLTLGTGLIVTFILFFTSIFFNPFTTENKEMANGGNAT